MAVFFETKVAVILVGTPIKRLIIISNTIIKDNFCHRFLLQDAYDFQITFADRKIKYIIFYSQIWSLKSLNQNLTFGQFEY